MRFEAFLEGYRSACARGDAGAILRHVSEEYRGTYVYPAGLVRVFDRQALAEAWAAAEEHFAANGARWSYETVALGARESERVAASWVSFLVSGQATGHSFLVETFRETPEGWKLTREHMEHRLEPMRKETDDGSA